MTNQPPQPRPAGNGPFPGGEPAPGVCEPWRAFADWAVRRLGADLSEEDGGYRVRQPSPDATAAPATTDSGYWRITQLTRRKREPSDEVKRIDFVASGERELVDRLITEVAELAERPTLAPADQPTATHEIAERLFGAYQIDGGKVHLGGCRLTPTRLVRWSAAEVEDGELVVRHTFNSDLGEPLPADLAEKLGLAGELVDAEPRGACGTPALASGDSAAGNQAESKRAATATVVALRAVGALEATIGAIELSIPFDDWARNLQPPPAVCPESRQETYHLLAVDDGRIAAAAATGVCAETGRRLLLIDLRTCGVTGRQLDAELCVACPVTGDPVAKQALATCPKCGQRVSRSVVAPDGCAGCRAPQKIPRDSPLRGELLRSAPALADWRGWRLAKTMSAQIVEASTLWRRIVVVFDLESGQPIHAATRPRFGGAWSPMPVDEL